MPNHFSSIGFEVTDASEFAALVERTAALATPLETSSGTYLLWEDPSGAELWLQLTRRRELIGVNPHFSGPARLRAHLTNQVHRSRSTELDGVFHAWAEPEPGEAHRVYPFLFDCPCRAAYDALALPGSAILQVAAFAHELDVHASVEAFEQTQAARDPKIAARSFVPAGLFRSEGDNDEPQSTAALTGTVLESGRRINGLSAAPFYWARVASLGGEYDVVIDAALTSEPPPVGGVVSGLFWLSAKLVRAAEPGAAS